VSTRQDAVEHDCLAEGAFDLRCADSVEPHGEEFSDEWIRCMECAAAFNLDELKQAAEERLEREMAERIAA
jgi:hypothetical protein